MPQEKSHSRSKACDHCQQDGSLLYRIQQDSGQEWVFVCPDCWHSVSQDNPYYCYGGTWKQRKKSR